MTLDIVYVAQRSFACPLCGSVQDHLARVFELPNLVEDVLAKGPPVLGVAAGDL